jgi:hypothetical protein
MVELRIFNAYFSYKISVKLIEEKELINIYKNQVRIEKYI